MKLTVFSALAYKIKCVTIYFRLIGHDIFQFRQCQKSMIESRNDSLRSLCYPQFRATARPAAPATRWIVSVGPVALETVAGDGVRIVLSSARFQGVDFVEVAAWRGQAVESSRTLFLPLAGEDLEARRGRLAEEVRRQELELEIRRLEAKLAWIADERRRLYLPPPGTGRYVGYGPVYSFTYGSFGYPGYGGSACHGGFTGGLDLGFFYSGGDFFFGAATRFR